MAAELIPCGAFANESERKAADKVKQAIERDGTPGRFAILTNVPLSVSAKNGVREIDQVVIGPTGIFVVEVKHWPNKGVKSAGPRREADAAKLNEAVKRVKGALPPDLAQRIGFLNGSFLLTVDPAAMGKNRPTLLGQPVFSLNKSDLREMLRLTEGARLTADDVARAIEAVHAPARITFSGKLRRIDEFQDLELQSPEEERFHRVFFGRNRRKERVALHLYDLSAGGPNAEAQARRESEAVQALQACPCVPRVVSTFRPVEGYPGELFCFATFHDAAPSLAERVSDPAWPAGERRAYAAAAFAALESIRIAATASSTTLAHRNITPDTLHVAAANKPLLTGFHLARFPGSVTVAPADGAEPSPFAPPELRSGSGVADLRSDVWSLAKSLEEAFPDDVEALEALRPALAEKPADRPLPATLARTFSILAGERAPVTPPARFWSEGERVQFRGSNYRLETRLGSGSAGTTWKVVELREDGEDGGTFVGKVVPDSANGARALQAMRRVRSHTLLGGVATVLECAAEWRDNEFVALLQHVPGSSLSAWAGLTSLIAEEEGLSEDELLLGWAGQVCGALAVFHGAGIVHGDVSPGNVLVEGRRATLTDFDLAVGSDEPRISLGTAGFPPAAAVTNAPAEPWHDVATLAAVLFQAATGRMPYDHGGEHRPDLGCNWSTIEGLPRLRRFIDLAVDPREGFRFTNGAAAVAHLEEDAESLTRRQSVDPKRDPKPTTVAEPKPVEPQDRGTAGPPVPVSTGTTSAEPEPVRPREDAAGDSANVVGWLTELLQAYPGGVYGNAETRGLDSDFATATYVETDLDRALVEEVRARRSRLVILCGNAGDGKTALLQNLFKSLGCGSESSRARTREETLDDGLTLRVNLDGSAAYRGRSADELMDELLAPFADGPPKEDLCHLLAVNDGRLLEWIEHAEAAAGVETWLTGSLKSLLGDESAVDGVCFINLNARSLVGEAEVDPKEVTDDFLAELVDRMIGGPRRNPEATWDACRTCIARATCRVNRTVNRLRGDRGSLLVGRLRQALQAVHQRGEVHITTRELRGVVSYALFGTSRCTDLHRAGELPELAQLAFDAGSERRQGDLLAELARLDPALEAQPRIDRHLRADLLQDSDDQPDPETVAAKLIEARRRAYFEWDEAEHEKAGVGHERIGLHDGEHLSLFRQVGAMSEAGQREICGRLLRGISRLEDLPPIALADARDVVLKVTPRTPIESRFWVKLPADRFILAPDKPAAAASVPAAAMQTLHTHLVLAYHHPDSQRAPERLRIGSELFGLLLQLAEGRQVSDVASDAAFAHLSIFTQRLAQEEQRGVFAWTPIDGERVYRIEPERVHEVQRLTLTPLEIGATDE